MGGGGRRKENFCPLQILCQFTVSNIWEMILPKLDKMAEKILTALES